MKPRWFVRGDLDGFFGLFIDNLLQLLIIAQLCPLACGMPAELVYGRILPGAALSVLFGNLFYAWQARRLALRTGRSDVTALPCGINTVSLFAFALLVMAPVYHETQDPALAWKIGVFACFVSGVLEMLGALAGDWLRRHTPRAALLSALAGIAVTFIAMGFVFQAAAAPLTAWVPMLLVVIFYASRIRLPLGIPGGVAAIAIGIALGWALGWWRASHGGTALAGALSAHLPTSAAGDLWGVISHPAGWKYMAVIFPMALINVVGSLQNLESAEAAGDRYETRSSLLANGAGSIVAALLGSAFPTTIYIGHPGWKAMGARCGYSILNGAAMALLCLCGGLALVQRLVPIEAMLGILLWVALVITAQAFQEVPRGHALAVAAGLIPPLAAWALLLIETTLRVAGSSLHAAAEKFGGQIHIHGVIALSQGFLLSSMALAAIMVFAIERRFLRAAGWALAASLLSTVGLIHAYDLTTAGVQNRFEFGRCAAPGFAAAYLVLSAILAALHFHLRGGNGLGQPSSTAASTDSTSP